MNKFMRFLVGAGVLILTGQGAWADSISAETRTGLFDDGTGTFVPQPIAATVYTFDFESLPQDSVLGPTDSFTLSHTVNPDVQIRISRPGSFLKVTNLAPFGAPADWGSRSLDPFIDFENPAGILFEVLGLSPGIEVLTLDVFVGDFAPSDTDMITWTRGANAVLDNETGSGFSQTEVGGLNSFGSDIIRSVVGRGGRFRTDLGTTDSTLFWDNFQVVTVAQDDIPDSAPAGASTFLSNVDTPGYIPGVAIPQPIPEPGTMALVAAGLAGVFLLRRRRR